MIISLKVNTVFNKLHGFRFKPDNVYTMWIVDTYEKMEYTERIKTKPFDYLLTDKKITHCTILKTII